MSVLLFTYSFAEQRKREIYHKEVVGSGIVRIEFLWFLIGFLPVGLPVMREAWESILQKDWFNEFSLMALASLGAFYIGEYPEALAVMLLYSIGEMLQDKAVNQASRNIKDLLDVRPEQVDVYRKGVLSTVSPREVNVGEVIEVKPGELFGMDEAMTVSLIPKSVTTPIAVSVAEGHGGMVPITVVAVIFTGILGSIFAPTLIRLFRVNDPMIAGISIGACSHAVGTSKAIELGETEGAMSGLAIGVCGILTVLFSMILLH